ncbi:hypothetical protein SISSUDRAFT_1047602 [Sistotremastrum suecicum HHB10207 ss-3]|uniref:Uncharacterized protein n=1 Tax=Sistotremastrum suecicum HHB10207 ss-3 TaxID=1314776 RepID=A0A166D0F4_9AGAM|nr:hypothetical protein SISSUDRAFT_1047602 [Sistotremastrum suecicum HHB10207 ss-3]
MHPLIWMLMLRLGAEQTPHRHPISQASGIASQPVADVLPFPLLPRLLQLSEVRTPRYSIRGIKFVLRIDIKRSGSKSSFLI